MNLWTWLKSLLASVPVPGDVEPPFNAKPAEIPPSISASNPNGADWANKFAPQPPPPANPNGADWYYKYAPKTKAPSAPQTAPVAAPKTEPTGVQVFQAILAYNNGLTLFKAASAWSEPVKGVVIHKIDEQDAIAIATRLKPVAAQFELPVAYVLGCLAIESTLDPDCENGNLGPGESNTQNDPLGYDMGIAQLKLRYLVNIAPGVTDAASAKAFAFDIDKAVPYHCSIMATKVLAAKNVIEANTSSAPDPRLSNSLLLATGMYNFGNTGMMAYYESGQFPSHCQHVFNLEQYFAKQLGVPSVFASLT